MIYLAACIWNWTGRSYEDITATGGNRAAVYSHSPLLLPFERTFIVSVPSQRDLNTHVVFQRTALLKDFTIRWRDAATLQVVCPSCQGKGLVEGQVDDVTIKVVEK